MVAPRRSKKKKHKEGIAVRGCKNTGDGSPEKIREMIEKRADRKTFANRIGTLGRLLQKKRKKNQKSAVPVAGRSQKKRAKGGPKRRRYWGKAGSKEGKTLEPLYQKG